MNNVVVLMSCYNGSRYIIEQITSILSQKNLFELCIRDDGSSDNTVSIINEYIKKNRETRIHLIRGQNLGIIKSFFELISFAEHNYSADFYAFADQDDYWFSDKTEVAVNELKKTNINMPALYLSQFQMADSMLNPIKTPHLHANIWLEAAMVNNIATGCTMVFNKSLLKIINRYMPNNITMHDYWIYLIALSIGADVYFDEKAHFLYRQHDHNVIGGFEEPFFNSWSSRLKKLFKRGNNYYSKMAKELLIGFYDLMPKNNAIFLKYASRPKYFLSKLYLVLNCKMIGSSFEKTLRCKILILTGKY